MLAKWQSQGGKKLEEPIRFIWVFLLKDFSGNVFLEQLISFKMARAHEKRKKGFEKRENLALIFVHVRDVKETCWFYLTQKSGY